MLSQMYIALPFSMINVLAFRGAGDAVIYNYLLPLSIFIHPPSIEELRRRLEGRATDAQEVIEQRLSKASYELTFADKFDIVIVNDDLEKAKADTLNAINEFLNK